MMKLKLFGYLSIALLGFLPVVGKAEDIGLAEAKSAAERSWECARSGDYVCAFESKHLALTSSAYIDALWKQESHSYLAEWEWYARYAFDAAEELSSSADKRRVIELAIETIANRPRPLTKINTPELDVLLAEACLELGDLECARSSARRVKAQEDLYTDHPAHPTDPTGVLVKWYSPHSPDAPSADEFRDRVDIVLELLD